MLKRLQYQLTLYSYLNLESTKTLPSASKQGFRLYSYLNLESTKTGDIVVVTELELYSYLNLESTKTLLDYRRFRYGCTVT